jgi:hypothetical protein
VKERNTTGSYFDVFGAEFKEINYERDLSYEAVYYRL